MRSSFIVFTVEVLDLTVQCRPVLCTRHDIQQLSNLWRKRGNPTSQQTWTTTRFVCWTLGVSAKRPVSLTNWRHCHLRQWRVPSLAVSGWCVEDFWQNLATTVNLKPVQLHGSWYIACLQVAWKLSSRLKLTHATHQPWSANRTGTRKNFMNLCKQQEWKGDVTSDLLKTILTPGRSGQTKCFLVRDIPAWNKSMTCAKQTCPREKSVHWQQLLSPSLFASSGKPTGSEHGVEEGKKCKIQHAATPNKLFSAV